MKNLHCFSAAVSALALIASDGALAQTMAAQQAADPAQSDTLADADNQIVVTGIRRSLERAADIKRESVQVVDAIVAQDIGKLPDPTPAAALQRVPRLQLSPNRNNELGSLHVLGLSSMFPTGAARRVFTT